MRFTATFLSFVAPLASCCLASLLPNHTATFYADPNQEGLHYTDYPVDPNLQTPKGILVDARNVAFTPDDLKQMDDLTDDVEKCLGQNIYRWGFSVKIVAEYQTNSGGEVFTCAGVPSGLCYGVVQWPAVAVITPNMLAYRHEIIHIVTRQGHESWVFRCQ